MTVEFFLSEKPDGFLEMRCSEMPDKIWTFAREYEARSIANVIMLRFFPDAQVSFGWESVVEDEASAVA